jgi:copper chaperone CopZ
MIQTTSTRSRMIKLEGMVGVMCVQKVANALNSVPDVDMRSVSVGTVDITADDEACDAAIAAISAAGFQGHVTSSDNTTPERNRLDDDGVLVVHTPAPKHPVPSGYPEVQLKTPTGKVSF